MSEAVRLRVRDLQLESGSAGLLPLVTLRGKRGKTRQCPLLRASARALADLVEGRAAGDAVFLNRLGRPITRSGMRQMVVRCAGRAPSLAARKVSPHTLRHTAATHLLRSGVDLNTIRAWLGHASLDTTTVYAEIDLATKAKAIALYDADEPAPTQPVRDDKGAMAFLRSL